MKKMEGGRGAAAEEEEGRRDREVAQVPRRVFLH
jgi:hypothetical protein